MMAPEVGSTAVVQVVVVLEVACCARVHSSRSGGSLVSLFLSLSFLPRPAVCFAVVVSRFLPSQQHGRVARSRFSVLASVLLLPDCCRGMFRSLAGAGLSRIHDRRRRRRHRRSKRLGKLAAPGQGYY